MNTDKPTADKMRELAMHLNDVADDLDRGLSVTAQTPAELNDDWKEIVRELAELTA